LQLTKVINSTVKSAINDSEQRMGTYMKSAIQDSELRIYERSHMLFGIIDRTFYCAVNYFCQLEYFPSSVRAITTSLKEKIRKRREDHLQLNLI
jgi:hypothetical protein